MAFFTRISFLFLAARLMGCGCGASVELGNEVVKVEQSPPAAVKEFADESTGEKVFMWEATSNSGKTIYLLGSIYLDSADFYPLATVIENAYQKSDALVVQVNTETVNPGELEHMIRALSVLPDEKTIESLVRPETWEALKKFMTKHEAPVELFIHNEPWYAALGVIMTRLASGQYSKALGIDVHFIKTGGKKIIELESPQIQISLFDKLSPELQDTMLLDALQSPTLQKENLAKISNAWLTGDAQTIEALIMVDPGMSDLYKALFDDRNATMAAKIEELLKKHDSLFVVVDAGHLVGKAGLVQIFKNKGYKLQQNEEKTQ